MRSGHPDTVTARQLRAGGAADLTRGGGPYAVRGSGWLLACPYEPDEGRREGSLVKSVAARVTAWASAAPKVSAFRASRPALAQAGAERQRERRPGRRVGGASGPVGPP